MNTAHSSESSGGYTQNMVNGLNQGRWTISEHHKFLKALKIHGKEWRKVQEEVETRTSTQARSHA